MIGMIKDMAWSRFLLSILLSLVFILLILNNILPAHAQSERGDTVPTVSYSGAETLEMLDGVTGGNASYVVDQVGSGYDYVAGQASSAYDNVSTGISDFYNRNFTQTSGGNAPSVSSVGSVPSVPSVSSVFSAGSSPINLNNTFSGVQGIVDQGSTVINQGTNILNQGTAIFNQGAGIVTGIQGIANNGLSLSTLGNVRNVAGQIGDFANQTGLSDLFSGAEGTAILNQFGGDASEFFNAFSGDLALLGDGIGDGLTALQDSLGLSDFSLNDLGLGDFSLDDLGLGDFNIDDLGLDGVLDDFDLSSLGLDGVLDDFDLSSLGLDGVLDDFDLSSLGLDGILDDFDLSSLGLDGILDDFDLSSLGLDGILDDFDLSSLGLDGILDDFDLSSLGLDGILDDFDLSSLGLDGILDDFDLSSLGLDGILDGFDLSSLGLDGILDDFDLGGLLGDFDLSGLGLGDLDFGSLGLDGLGDIFGGEGLGALQSLADLGIPMDVLGALGALQDPQKLLEDIATGAVVGAIPQELSPSRFCVNCAVVAGAHVATGLVISTSHSSTQGHITSGFETHRNSFWLGDYFPNHILPALQAMTEQLVTVGMNQAFILGTFFDASHQIQTERMMQEKVAEAYKDYQPDIGMCTVGTLVRSLNSSEQFSDFTSHVLSQRALRRESLQRSMVSAGGPGEEKSIQRMNIFKAHYCQSTDYGGDALALCNTSANNHSVNKDIDFVRTAWAPKTLNIDFNDGLDSGDERDVFALASNLYSHTVMENKKVNRHETDSDVEYVLDRRSIQAKRSVAQHSFNSIVGQKAAGSASADGVQYMASVLKQLGLGNDTEIVQLLGSRPSYYAQMELLTKKLYQNPAFYTSLYTQPANVSRRAAALRAIGLMQNMDTYKSQLRNEAMLAVLLEATLHDSQKEVQGAFNE